jgi:hypothetical protein
MLYRLTGVILLVILAVFFAYLVAPLVDLACRPRTMAGRARANAPSPRHWHPVPSHLQLPGRRACIPAPATWRSDHAIRKQAPVYVGFVRTQIERLSQVYETYQLPAAVRETVNSAAVHMIETTGRSVTEGLGRILIDSIGYLPWLILNSDPGLLSPEGCRSLSAICVAGAPARDLALARR